MSKNSHQRKYTRYMASSKWKDKRKLVLERAGHKCERCGIKQAKGLHVHHLTYKNLGNEPLEDLQALCRNCHADHHPGKIVKHGAVWTGRRFRVVAYGSRFLVLDVNREVVSMPTEKAAVAFAQGADRSGRPKDEEMKPWLSVKPKPRKPTIGRRFPPQRPMRPCKRIFVDPGVLKEKGTEAAIAAKYAA